MKSKNLIIGLLGGISLAATATLVAREIEWSEVPDAVKATVQSHAGELEVSEVERDRERGRVTYEVELDDDSELLVAEDGTLLESCREIRPRELPEEIRARIRELGGRVDEIEERTIYAADADPKVVYEVEYRDGSEVVINTTGTVIEQKAAEESDDDGEGNRRSRDRANQQGDGEHGHNARQQGTGEDRADRSGDRERKWNRGGDDDGDDDDDDDGDDD